MGSPLATNVRDILDTDSEPFKRLLELGEYPAPPTVPAIKRDVLECLGLAPGSVASFPRFAKWVTIKNRTSGGKKAFRVSEWHPEQQAFELNRTGRDIVVKSRQIGMSTGECARDLFYALSHPSSHVLIVAHRESVAKELLATVKDLYESFHEVCVTVGLGHKFPSLRETRGSRSGMISQAHKLKFENGSTVEAKTAGNSEAATDTLRGSTADRLHLTEFAYWTQADRAWETLLPATHERSEIVVESTPNGSGNCFHRQAMNALARENSFSVHFYPWFLQPLNTKALEPGEVISPATPEEIGWLREGATPGHLKFYRQRLRDYSGNTDRMRSEYPSDLVGAFVVSGNGFLGQLDRDRLGKALRKPQEVAFLQVERKGTGEVVDVAVNLFRDLGSSPGGFACWTIGVDCADGVGGDNTAICVLDGTSGEIVATVADKRIKPFEAATVIERLCERWFPGALVVVEDQGAGSSCLMWLQQSGKVNLFTWGEFHTERGGFNTNVSSRRQMFEYLREWIQSGSALWVDDSTFSELAILVYEEGTGKVIAPGKTKQGKKKKEDSVRDDRVFAFGFALWGLKESTGGMLGTGGFSGSGPIVVHGESKREFRNIPGIW